MALAGPAVNVVIAAVCYAALAAAAGAPPALSLDPTATGFVGRFMAVNLALAVFNMVPAFPMDGGRALRATLAERIDYVRATEVAASIGQGLALVLGLDMSGQKNWMFANASRLEFHWEICNVFNRANFDVPNRFFGSPNFGRIFSAQHAREMQFGLRYSF